MRVLVHDADRCVGCHTCEETCSQAWFKEVDRSKAAIQILDADPAAAGATSVSEAAYRAIVCTQCGECIDVCPSMALSRNVRGVVIMDKGACVGCLSCVGFCGIWAMRTHPDHLQPFKCVACGRCVKACPEGALRIEEQAEPEPSETAKWAERVG